MPESSNAASVPGELVSVPVNAITVSHLRNAIGLGNNDLFSSHIFSLLSLKVLFEPTPRNPKLKPPIKLLVEWFRLILEFFEAVNFFSSLKFTFEGEVAEHFL